MRKLIFVFVVILCLFYFKPIVIKANSCIPNAEPTISGEHNFDYEIGDDMPNWLEGISAKDSCQIDVEVSVNDKDVNLLKEGSYFLYYYAKGSSKTVIVHVFEDMTKPEILGAEDITIEVNSTNVNYLRNVTVTDNKDLEIGSKLIIDFSKVDVSKVGVYKLDYKVTDYKNNTAQITVNVNVVDTIYPILENVNNKELEVKQSITNIDWWWEGVILSDNSNLFQKTIEFGSFDINKVGIYSITYKIIDGSGNTTEKKIKVSVVDKIKPELVLNRELRIKISDDNSNMDWLNGIDIIDNYENIPLSKVICDTSNVNLNIPGTYKILYFVSDSSGNYFTLEKEVVVYDDDLPVIHNVVDFNIFVNTEYFDFKQNITASDTTDGDITHHIIIYDKNVNLSKVGKYKLFYIVTDRSGNTTIETVNVNVYDNEGPVISGTKDLFIEVFSTNNDFLKDVSAIDNIDGSLDVDVDITHVDFNKLGEYTITYSVMDSNNNLSEISVKVTIVDTTKPVIEGYKDLNILVGGSVNLLDNIKAIDNYDGDITNKVIISGTYDVNKVGEYQIKIEIEDSSKNYASAYFKLIVKEQQIIEGVDQKTMYYIVGGIGATILVFGFVSYLTRKRSRFIHR